MINKKDRENLPRSLERVPDIILSQQEARILHLRLGFETGKYETQAEIGKMYGITGSRIQVIEHRAKRKIRHFHVLRKLYEPKAVSLVKKK